MQQATLTLFVLWLCLAPDCISQNTPPSQSVRISVSGVTLEGADSIPESITSRAKQKVTADPFEELALGPDSTARVRQVLYSYGYLESVVDSPSVKEVASLTPGGE